MITWILVYAVCQNLEPCTTPKIEHITDIRACEALANELEPATYLAVPPPACMSLQGEIWSRGYDMKWVKKTGKP